MRGSETNNWQKDYPIYKIRLENLGKNFQLCLGQKFGIEYDIHSLRNEFDKPEMDATLLFDAENAFKLLNRELDPKNVEILCSALNMRWPFHISKA